MLEEQVKAVIREIPDFPKVGINFKDITPLLKDAALVQQLLESTALQLKELNVQGIAGIESRGFLYGFALAQKMNIAFIPIRKKGKLPHKTISVRYGLEYGNDEVEMHLDAVEPGQRILIHDDLLATGGTAAAAAELVSIAGAKVVGFHFLVNLLHLNGEQKLFQYSNNIISETKYSS